MPSFKDTAHIDAGSVPDFLDDSPEGIAATAQFVWFAVLNRVNKAKATQPYMDGRPGYMWQGAVNSVISDIWPESKDSYREDREKIQEIKLAVNEYHRVTKTLVCRRRAIRGGQALWWVAKHWAGLTVTSKNTQEPEEKEENRMSETSTGTPYPCREPGCRTISTLPQIRASHEFRAHAFRIKDDGSRVDLPPGKLSDDDLADLVLTVAKEAKGPESVYYFIEKAQEADPRATRNRTRKTVEHLAESSMSDLIVFGSSQFYTKYYLASRAEQAREKVVAELTETPAAAADEVAVDPDGLSLGEHITNVTSLLAMLRTLEEQVQADVQASLDAKDSELAALRAELEEVKKERDQLQKTLKVFRSNFAKFDKILGKDN